MVTMKRVYDPATSDDGYRVLVERLWPRGVSKGAAHLDAWEKGVAPSDELRRWYGHDPEKWEEFQKRYQEELKDPAVRPITPAYQNASTIMSTVLSPPSSIDPQRTADRLRKELQDAIDSKGVLP